MGRNKSARRKSEAAILALKSEWDKAVHTGLMDDDTEVNWRLLPATGEVLSDAIGREAQLLVDGRELTPEWAAELRRTKPAFAGLVDIFAETSSGWFRLTPVPPHPYGE